MSFTIKQLGKLAVLVIAILIGTAGCQAKPSAPVKGPRPVLTQRAARHIEERHVQLRLFPEKSKFRSEIDWRSLLFETYDRADAIQKEFDRYIYDYTTDRMVGTRGQSRTRLVTEEDGDVVTFYPRF